MDPKNVATIVSRKPDAESAVIRLRIVSGPHAGDELVISGYDSFTIGRDPEARMCVEQDPFFSRLHCRVEVAPPLCRVMDLASSSGTFLNGKKVQYSELRHGDQFGGGDTQIVYLVERSLEPENNVESPPPTLVAKGSMPAELPADRKSVVNPATEQLEQTIPIDIVSDGTRDHASLPEQPDRIGMYEIAEEIGRGSMGIVYRANHVRTGEAVALKLVCAVQSSTKKQAELFVREASILGQLDHKHIVGAVEFGLHQDQPYLAMEYVPSVDLLTLLDSQEYSVRQRIACGVTVHVLEALHFAHQKGIVHRDVKPCNILASLKDGKLKVKLGDFGLAKNYLDAGYSTLTKEQEIRGTLAYMSPQQLADCRYTKPDSDVYSSGACLYRMLTGHFTRDLPNDSRALGIALSQPVDPIVNHLPDIQADLARIVHRSLESDASARYQDADSMRQELLPFAAGKA